MLRMLKSLTTLLCLLPLIGYSNGGSYGAPVSLTDKHFNAANINKATFVPLPKFVAIQAKNINLEIRQGSFQRVFIQGAVQPQVENGVLVLEAQTPNSFAKIWLPNLRGLYLSGNSQANGYSLHFNSPLQITLYDNARLSLQGFINIQTLATSGNSSANIQWVQANHLIVREIDHSVIQLAGVAKILDARLFNNTVLNAKYLRATQSYIQTSDSALAQVLAIQSLNAFANQNSNIYYFKSPYFILCDSYLSGNVLQVDYWN